jgi:hypothetical protein
MWTIILNIFQAIGGSLFSKFADPIFSGIKKYWKGLLILLVIAGLCVFGYLKYKAMQDAIVFWQNESAKYKGIIKLREGVYEAQVQKVKEIELKNKELQKRLSETGREARFYEELTLIYKAKFDSIRTKPAYVVYKTDTLYKGMDSTDRAFDVSFDNQLFLKGYFQTQGEYLLFIKELILKMQLDILISQDDYDVWHWNIDTHSKYLVPENVKISLVEAPRKWEYFYGATILGIAQPSLAMKGIDLTAGLKRGTYGVSLHTQFQQGGQPYYGIGIIKFGVF